MSNLKFDVNEITADIERIVWKHLDNGLDKAADRLVEELVKTSPDNSKTTKNKYKNSWKVNRKYKNVRFVGNSKIVKDVSGKDIALSNLLEYGDGEHHGQIRNTYHSVEQELHEIIIKELSKI